MSCQPNGPAGVVHDYNFFKVFDLIGTILSYKSGEEGEVNMIVIVVQLLLSALCIRVSHKSTNVMKPRFTPRNHAPGHIKSQIFWNF